VEVAKQQRQLNRTSAERLVAVLACTDLESLMESSEECAEVPILNHDPPRWMRSLRRPTRRSMCPT